MPGSTVLFKYYGENTVNMFVIAIKAQAQLVKIVSPLTQCKMFLRKKISLPTHLSAGNKKQDYHYFWP